MPIIGYWIVYILYNPVARIHQLQDGAARSDDVVQTYEKVRPEFWIRRGIMYFSDKLLELLFSHTQAFSAQKSHTHKEFLISKVDGEIMRRN